MMKLFSRFFKTPRLKGANHQPKKNGPQVIEKNASAFLPYERKSKNTHQKFIVDRKKLNWFEALYLPAIFSGMFITLKHIKKSLFGKGIITMQYPEEKWDSHLPEWYRGAPTLVKDEHGRERCVSCQLCEFICPPRAIVIKPMEIAEGDPWRKVEKAPRVFDIDMARCIYCGLCEEVCPEQAIYLRKDYSITGLNRTEMIHHKEQLYEMGGVMTGLVFKWNEKK